MVRLIERYGIEIIKKRKNRYYSPKLKEEIINKVLFKGHSRKSVSLDYALPNPSLLKIGYHNTRKMGTLLLRKQERVLKKLKELEDRDEALQRES